MPQHPIYITRPERVIWPVVAFVALTLFSAAAEATIERVRWVVAASQSVTAQDETGTIESGHGHPAGELKPTGRPGVVARQGQPKVAPEVRVAARRAAIVVRLRSTVAQGHALEAKSHRQLVFSPRPGGLVRYFPTAPPRV